MKKFLKIILILLLLIAIFMACAVFYLSRGLEAGSNVEVSAVDPAALSDGTYHGSYTAGRWANEVAVTVQGGKITNIEVVKDVRFASKEVTDELFSRVIKAQNTTVDVVSQATVTSKAYLKSIESSLSK